MQRPVARLDRVAARGRNLENNCLIGYFKDKVVAKNMTVGSGTATSEFTPLAIQLIH
jgi:hypothetical protein